VTPSPAPEPEAGTPSGIAAIVIAHGSAPLLGQTLAAVAGQELRPDYVVLVRAGQSDAPAPDDGDARPDPASPPGLLLVDAPTARTLGDAVQTAAGSDTAGLALSQARWWWILHDDSAPEPACLAEEWRIADRGRTIALVGPKQLSWAGEHLLEAGIAATRTARRLETIAAGEIDQGQYDDRSDVLAVGTAGMLVSRRAWQDLEGTDPALGPFGDGLEFGRRVHRAGLRVVLAPRARVRHARQSLGADPDTSFRARRTAQLYTWIAAVPWWQVPLLALWLLVWTPARALARILTGARHLAGDEFAAWAALIPLTGSLWRTRRRCARQARVPRSVLASLEARPRDLAAQRRLIRRVRRAQRRDRHLDPLIAASARRHRARSWSVGAGVVGTLVAASLVIWARMLGGAAGAAWAGAPASWWQLWQAAWAAWVPGGDGAAGPGDPVLIPLALLSAPFAMVGVAPTTVWSWLLVLAAPLAGLSAWALACSLTASVPTRAAAALTWAAVPALTVSASQGRLAAVLAHIALPMVILGWTRMVRGPAPLVVSGAEGPVPSGPPGHRAPWAGGIAAWGLFVAACCVPWLLGAAILGLALHQLASLTGRAARRGRGAVEPRGRPRGSRALALTLLPALAAVAPLAARSLTTSGGWAALLTPGGPALATEPAASWWLAVGVPGASSWNPHPWMLACLVPAMVIALAVGIAWRGGRGLDAVAVPGLVAALSAAVAVLLQRVPVAVAETPDGTAQAAAWPAPALSVCALALIVAGCRLTASADTPWDAPSHRAVRIASAALGAVAALTLGVWGAIGPLGAGDQAEGAGQAGGDHVAGAGQQVPSITREAQSSPRRGRLLILDQAGTPGAGTGGETPTLTARLLRGDGPQMTDASALTRLDGLRQIRSGALDGAASDLARQALTVVSAPDDATATALARHGIDAILIADTASEPGATLAEALDRAPGLELVGHTDYGTVWRVRPDAGLPARITLVDGDQWTPVASQALGADTRLADGAQGTLVLAERADPSWHATLDGEPLAAIGDDTAGWRQAFQITGGGRLVVEYRTWWLLPWRIATGAALAGAALAAIPARRRR
jgi:GT2 family glycosyltransferase